MTIIIEEKIKVPSPHAFSTLQISDSGFTADSKYLLALQNYFPGSRLGAFSYILNRSTFEISVGWIGRLEPVTLVVTVLAHAVWDMPLGEGITPLIF